MAGNIKGVTIEFRGETTKLDKALKQVKNDAKGVDNELKQVNRALKFNPSNAELLRQKFDLLKQKVDQTEKELQEFRAIEKQLNDRNVSKQSEEWRTVRRNIIEAESKLKHFNAEMNKVKYANITALGNSFKTAGQNMRMAGMYSTIGAGVLVMSGKKLLEMNSKQQQAETKLIEIYKTRMGVDKQAAQSTMELASAIQKVGVVGDEVTLSGAQMLATFAKTPETVNTLLPALDDMLVQLYGTNVTEEQAANTAKLFGKVLTGQTSALKKNGITFTEAQEEILKYGTEEEKAAVLAEVVTQNVGHMNKAMAETDEGKLKQVSNRFGDIGERLGKMLLPALSNLADFIDKHILPAMEKMMSFMEKHPAIAKFAVALTVLLAVGGPLLIFFGAIVSAIGTLMAALGSIVGIVTGAGAAFAALSGPIGIVIAVIAGLVAAGIALYKHWDQIKAWAITTWGAIQNAVQVVVDRIKTNFNTLKTTLSNVWNGIKTTASTVWNAIKTAITSPIQTAMNTVKTIINKIKGFFPLKIGKIFSGMKLPHFNVNGGKAPFGLMGKGVKPSITVDWYAKGGIFDSPSIIGVGEAGSEAVVPLDTLWKKMDAIAEASAAGAVVVNVYGSANMSVDELAAAVERKIIQMQKRRTSAWA